LPTDICSRLGSYFAAVERGVPTVANRFSRGFCQATSSHRCPARCGRARTHVSPRVGVHRSDGSIRGTPALTTLAGPWPNRLGGATLTRARLIHSDSAGSALRASDIKAFFQVHSAKSTLRGAQRAGSTVRRLGQFVHRLRCPPRHAEHVPCGRWAGGSGWRLNKRETRGFDERPVAKLRLEPHVRSWLATRAMCSRLQTHQ